MRTLGIVCLASIAWGANASPDQVRSAAAKGIALIQASQKDWYKKQSCYSCHQQSLPALAIRAAREHGIPVNEELARESSKAFDILMDLDRAVQFTHEIDPAISESYLLLGANAAGVPRNAVTGVYARLIASRQKSDGHWQTLDVRPPQSYSTITATAVASRALQLYTHPSLAAATKSRIENARNWLASRHPEVTEERTAQLFGLAWTGADAALIAKTANALKASQQPDGGWNSRPGRPSDAYSTGEALVALHEAGGVAVSDAAWQRGIDFLLRTQAADGSWHVASRIQPPAPVSPPYFETGYPYGHDQFISAMGAAWAVGALAASLSPGKPVDLPASRSAALEPWVETALFGTRADLAALLGKGLDPNSATKGGTTLLMLVQPDLEKTRLLLDRGANINARAKTGYSALMVAAQYPESTSAMQLLLERGAEVLPPKGSRTPLFNASAFTLASISGNIDILPALRKAGARPDSQMLLLGSFPASPLLSAAFFRDVPLARAVLDAGAKVDQPDSDGITALGWAAIGCETPVAKVLIEHGADVNHVDKKGMTPLLYAASIDFGDSSMVELLLKSGANAKAKTREGLTAAELARKYGHNQVLKALAPSSGVRNSAF